MKSNKLTNQAVNNLIGKNLRKVRDAKGKSRREVSEKLGVSAITITHDISSINNLASRVILLDKKKIAWSGRPIDMKSSKNIIKRLPKVVKMFETQLR